MILLYKLDEHGQPVPCEDPIEWAMWMAENPDRRIAQDQDGGDEGERVRVSTVFLGVDTGLPYMGAPVLWETMIFGGLLDRKCKRYSSRDDALAGHQKMCALVRATIHRKDTP